MRTGEQDSVSDLLELLSDEIKGCWWLCMCCLEAVWVLIVEMML